jgi:hypothetical protein
MPVSEDAFYNLCTTGAVPELSALQLRVERWDTITAIAIAIAVAIAVAVAVTITVAVAVAVAGGNRLSAIFAAIHFRPQICRVLCRTVIPKREREREREQSKQACRDMHQGLTLPLHYTTLHYTTLHYTTLHYTTLHYTPLHYTALHCTTLH